MPSLLTENCRFNDCKDELQRRLGRSTSVDRLDKDLASLLE